MEPLQFKGGTLFELCKGKGPHSQVKSYRGILLVNCIGKAYRRVLRGELLDNAIKHFTETQFGGLPHRGTEQASHMLRLFLEFHHQRSSSAGVVFVDAVSAFYVVLKQIVMSLEVADEDIAFLFKSLGMPPSALHELAKILSRASPACDRRQAPPAPVGQ